MRKKYTLEELKRIGSREGVLQIVPPRHVMRPHRLHVDDHELIDNPLATPTGPNGAPSFANKNGSQIATPRVTNVYLGPFWDDKNAVEQFSKAVVEQGYLDPLATYGYGTQAGGYAGAVDGAPLSGAVYSDAQARKDVAALLDAKKVVADPNALVMLILPDGVTSQASDGTYSCTGHCGYHDAITYGGTDIAYGVLPACKCDGCGGGLADFTAMYAHELAEACTDKVPGQGWITADGQENADLEAWILVPWGPALSFTVQGYYTNELGKTVGAYRG